MPRWLLTDLLWGAGAVVVVATMAVVSLLLYDRSETRSIDADTAAASPIKLRKHGSRLLPLICVLLADLAAFGLSFYSLSTRPEYDAGLNTNTILLLHDKLRHVTPRDVLIECSSFECIPLTNSFAYLFNTLGWPHTADDPENGIISHEKDTEGVVGLQLSPNDQTTRLIKQVVEHATTLRINLVRTLLRRPLEKRIVLIIGSKPP